MDQHNRDLIRQELDSAREAEYDARSFEEARARAAALDHARIDAILADADAVLARHEALLDRDEAPDADDRAWWAALNTAFHSTPPAPRYHVEAWDVGVGVGSAWCRIVDSAYDAAVSHHADLADALRTLAVLNDPAFGDDAPTDPDPAGEARGPLAGHLDTEAGR